MGNCTIDVLRTGPREVPLPRYETEGAAGMDLRADLVEPVTIAPGARMRVPTGLAFAIPSGFEGQVRPRSGLAARQGLTVLNAPGTIDSDFRGEVMVLLVNFGDAPVTVAPGDRVAQLVVCPVVRAELRPVASLSTTVRGEGGYGSTGTR